MNKTMLERLLEPIARSRQISPSKLRIQMEQTMNEALQNPDPAVQTMWHAIPKAGEEPTLEEFMEYLIQKNLLIP